MVASDKDLRQLLQGTFLAHRSIATVAAADAQETALVVEVGSAALEAWTLLRSNIALTGRWPVLTTLDVDRSIPWQAQVEQSDLFSRFGFDDEDLRGRQGNSPDAVVQASTGLDIAQSFAKIPKDESITTEEFLEVAIDDTLRRFGATPQAGDALDFLGENRLYSVEDIERWFLAWEIATFPGALDLPEAGLAHLKWFEPRNDVQALVLTPSDRGWEVPAYMNWYGAARTNSQLVVALLREWNEKYGAELVAHFGTMLQLYTTRRPDTWEEAFQLAWQQHMIAPCTTLLPGISLRDRARALMHTNQWFLHERP